MIIPRISHTKENINLEILPLVVKSHNDSWMKKVSLWLN